MHSEQFWLSGRFETDPGMERRGAKLSGQRCLHAMAGNREKADSQVAFATKQTPQESKSELPLSADRLGGNSLARTSNAKFEDRRDPIDRRVLALVVAVGVAVAAGLEVVQLLLPEVPDAAICHFAAYPAEELFRGKPKEPALGGLNILDPFRPFIALAARDGPNFAGAYTVVPYQIDKRSVEVLVISARTGMVHRAPNATGYVVRHRLNSRLLVYQVDPTWRKAGTTKYFVFRGGRFSQVNKPASHSDC